MSDSNETVETQAAVGAAVQATAETPPAGEPPELSPESLESSTPFIGRWNELVSTTNWEKGRVISEWRAALRKADAPVTDYSDEAWARLVGGVTSQHVGRLRRAHERFGEVCSQYPGLYWSHFQAGLDWDDPEMWLEGAITNEWSVSQMRAARWEARGGPEEPTDATVIEAQIDEDAYHALVDEPAPPESPPRPTAPSRPPRPNRPSPTTIRRRSIRLTSPPRPSRGSARSRTWPPCRTTSRRRSSSSNS